MSLPQSVSYRAVRNTKTRGKSKAGKKAPCHLIRSIDQTTLPVERNIPKIMSAWGEVPVRSAGSWRAAMKKPPNFSKLAKSIA
jgi:hypothetical protein